MENQPVKDPMFEIIPNPLAYFLQNPLIMSPFQEK